MLPNNATAVPLHVHEESSSTTATLYLTPADDFNTWEDGLMMGTGVNRRNIFPAPSCPEGNWQSGHTFCQIKVYPKHVQRKKVQLNC